MNKFSVPVLGCVAWSGSGKTTLLSKVIPVLKARGMRVAVIKHAHHSFDIDHPGKDSYTLRKSGADEVIVASRGRIASIRETPEFGREPELNELLSMLRTEQLDLVIVEGFKAEPIPKMEVHRSELDLPFLYPDDQNILALVQDSGGPVPGRDIECLNIEKPEQVVAFIESFVADRGKVTAKTRKGGLHYLSRLAN